MKGKYVFLVYCSGIDYDFVLEVFSKWYEANMFAYQENLESENEDSVSYGDFYYVRPHKVI